ncbi:MAG: ABC1 kinase family protein [Solirubrobacteraceae bacterium]
MKSLTSIPIKKIDRASKILTTGAKVGMNYVKYYGEKLLNTSEDKAKQNLNESNAEDIYNSLKELKGSVLKVAQMLSMEKNLLPQAYTDKFSLAQFSVPPLSGPLVQKTFKKYFGKTPSELFDTFEPEASFAASIGQVHKATKGDKKLAVKIQYPGVAESISSDLALVKPFAFKMFNITSKNSDVYFKEVEEKLLEETNYVNELEQAVLISKATEHIPNLKFPTYYPEFSSEKVITMDWMEGKHLSEFIETGYLTENANKIGQTLWDFYMYQLFTLQKVHADPHPGNFIVSDKNELIVLDFGCTKNIPDDFFKPYIEMITNLNIINDPIKLNQKLFEFEILSNKDSEEEKEFFTKLFYNLFSLFIKPFEKESFDFSDKTYFESITNLGMSLAKNEQIRKYNPNRGSKHFIYLNRTLLGLFNLLHSMGAKNIETKIMVI